MSSSSRNPGRRGERRSGFALLEFVAAFALLTLFLSAVLAALAMAMRNDRQAAFVTLAGLLARSKLAAAGVDFPLRPGTTAAAFPNGYGWRADVRSLGAVEIADGRRAAGYEVRVTVSRAPGAGPSVVLSGVELVPEAAR